MIKLSLKLDVSISKLVLVFVGSAACYGVSQFVSGLIRSAPQQNFSDSIANENLSDVVLCRENNQESTDFVRNRTTLCISENHRVNKKVVSKNLVTVSASNRNKVDKNLSFKQSSQTSGVSSDPFRENVKNQKIINLLN